MQQVGGSIGTALLNTLAASAATTYLAHHTAKLAGRRRPQLHSYATAYWWSAALFAVGGVLALLMYRGGRPAHRPTRTPSQPSTCRTHGPSAPGAA